MTKIHKQITENNHDILAEFLERPAAAMRIHLGWWLCWADFENAPKDTVYASSPPSAHLFETVSDEYIMKQIGRL